MKSIYLLALLLTGCAAHKPVNAVHGYNLSIAPECLSSPILLRDCKDDQHCDKVLLNYKRACAIVGVEPKPN